jgi:hypothetical protein
MPFMSIPAVPAAFNVLPVGAAALFKLLIIVVLGVLILVSSIA